LKRRKSLASRSESELRPVTLSFVELGSFSGDGRGKGERGEKTPRRAIQRLHYWKQTKLNDGEEFYRCEGLNTNEGKKGSVAKKNSRLCRNLWMTQLQLEVGRDGI